MRGRNGQSARGFRSFGRGWSQLTPYTRHAALLRWPAHVSRAVAWIVLVVFSASCLNPTFVAAKEVSRQKAQLTAPAKTDLETFGEQLAALEQIVDRLQRRVSGKHEFEWQEIAARGGHGNPPPAAARRADLKSLDDQATAAGVKIEGLQGAVRAYFAQVDQQLKDRGAPAAAQARQDEQRAQYDLSYASLKGLLQDLRTAHDDAAFAAAVGRTDAFLKSHSSTHQRVAFDPKQLGFGPSKAKPRDPITDPAALAAAIGADLATGKSTPAGAAKAAAIPELSESDDVRLTDAIRAKAQALGRNPVAILNFVRNNVEFLPTYGSIQGADHTLATLRGNAFDQASLLIALLRASDIPARYVYGTAEAPIDQVKNWVGGVDSPIAALEMLGAGGIPAMGLANGGVIQKARFEHIWVEAFVDYVPSRGAVNRAGDTWVALDPSFKQYDYSQGMSVAAQVPFDTRAFTDHLTATSTVNAQEGWVQGVDQAYVRQQLSDYETRLTDYVDSHKAGATVSDVLGSKTIKGKTLALIPGSAPYTVAATASRFAEIPSSLRWKFHFALNGQNLIEQSLPLLAGKQMALSFKPATQADEDTLKSLVPPNATSIDQLPTSLPGYLINLTAEFSVDGQTIATGLTDKLGTEVMTRKGLYIPGRGWNDTDNPLTVGDYQAVGLDGAQISEADARSLKARFEAAKQKLEAKQYAGLTKHDLTGAILQTGLLSYFAQTLADTTTAARTAGALSYRLPSYGTLSTDSQVQYWFGIPRATAPKGVRMDMDRMASASIAKDGDHEKWKAFNKTAGNLLSAHEHTVLQEILGQPDRPVEAISAVKAIAVAASQGQRIYTISAANVGVALAALNLNSDAEAEIADAVNAGYTVVTHQNMLSIAGQTTAGYVIADNDTGAASYKIAGGADGSFGAFLLTLILVLAAIAVALVVLLLAETILAVVLAAWALYWAVDTYKDWIERMSEARNDTQFNQAAFIAAISALMGLLPFKFLDGVPQALAAVLFGEAFVKIWECVWYGDKVPWCLF